MLLRQTSKCLLLRTSPWVGVASLAICSVGSDVMDEVNVEPETKMWGLQVGQQLLATLGWSKVSLLVDFYMVSITRFMVFGTSPDVPLL